MKKYEIKERNRAYERMSKEYQTEKKVIRHIDVRKSNLVCEEMLKQAKTIRRIK